jgi:hypothetical protein
MLTLIKPLNAANAAARRAADNAREAIQALADAGSTVIDFTWRGGRAVIRIDRAPPSVRGVLTVRCRTPRSVERVFAAPFRGTQIEWIEHEYAPRVTAGAAR